MEKWSSSLELHGFARSSRCLCWCRVTTPTPPNVIVSNLSRDNILFSTFCTGLFLLYRKNTGGARPLPGPSPGPSLCYGTVLLRSTKTVGHSCLTKKKYFWWGSQWGGGALWRLTVKNKSFDGWRLNFRSFDGWRLIFRNDVCYTNLKHKFGCKF